MRGLSHGLGAVMDGVDRGLDCGLRAGREFDDAANQFLLHPYARFDVSAGRDLGRGFSVFAGAQNVLNRNIDAGLAPILTLAAPRLVQGGLRYPLGR